MATLRSRHSWTRWRLRRLERRLDRERARLALLYQLGSEQVLLVERLEREVLPLRVVEQRPQPELEPPSPPPVMAPAPVTPEPQHQEPPPELEPTLPEQQPEPEEPREQAALEIARLIGLPRQPSTPRASSS